MSKKYKYLNIKKKNLNFLKNFDSFLIFIVFGCLNIFYLF